MNIFILDYDPKINVKYYCNAHVTKMCVEYTQMLCSAFYYTNYIPNGIYKLAYKNHPCTKWVRASLSNWKYLKRLALLTCKEYTYRYDKIHKCENVIKSLPIPEITDIGLTPFVKSMPDYCKMSDTVESYRNYYNIKKRKLFKWKHRDIPYWISFGKLLYNNDFRL